MQSLQVLIKIAAAMKAQGIDPVEAVKASQCEWEQAAELVKRNGPKTYKRFKATQHNNSTGHKGVTFNKSAKKYQAKIGNGSGGYIHLGYFDTIEAAAEARAEAENRLWK